MSVNPEKKNSCDICCQKLEGKKIAISAATLPKEICHEISSMLLQNKTNFLTILFVIPEQQQKTDISPAALEQRNFVQNDLAVHSQINSSRRFSSAAPG